MASADHSSTDGKLIPAEHKLALLKSALQALEPETSTEVVETHMSWVFLTTRRAYKLKKPVRYSYLDFSTVAARRRHCAEELRLNRMLAPGVYLGLVAVTADRGGIALDGQGPVLDWLVEMKRMPRERNLKHMIEAGNAREEDVRRAIEHLVRFYRARSPAGLTPADYRRRLETAIALNETELLAPAYELSRKAVRRVIDAERRYLEEAGPVLDRRVEEGRIIEGHGDLRPEHVYVGDPPVFLDRLEFEPDFRLLDPADELSFFAVECAFLGAPRLGDVAIETYERETRDRPPRHLIAFYKSMRATLRARLAIHHLADGETADFTRWRASAESYLASAAAYARSLARVSLR